MDGIWEQLFSIKSGYFFFNPIVILGMPLVIWMIHKRLFSFFDGCVVSSFIIQVLFYAKWEYPLGGPGIGPRYLVVTTPLLFLLIRPATWRFFRITPIKYLSLALVFVSLFIQIANVSVKPQTYWTLQARALEELSTPHWLANVKFFEHKITRGNELYKIAEFGAKNSRSISLADAPTLVGFNYWWLHVWRQSHREPMV